MGDNIFKAAQRGDKELVVKFLEGGIFVTNSGERIKIPSTDVNARDIWGSTPLLCAAYGGHQEVVAYLESAGAKLDTKDNDGNTALMLAAERGHLMVVASILEAIGENYARLKYIDAEDKNGNTAMILACVNGHEKVSMLLREKGAKLGEIALNYAYSKGFGVKLDPDPKSPSAQRMKSTLSLSLKGGGSPTEKNVKSPVRSSGTPSSPVRSPIRSKPSSASSKSSWKSKLFGVSKHGKVAVATDDLDKIWEFLHDEENFIDMEELNSCMKEIGLSKPEKLNELENQDHMDLLRTMNRIAGRRYRRMFGIEELKVRYTRASYPKGGVKRPSSAMELHPLPDYHEMFGQAQKVDIALDNEVANDFAGNGGQEGNGEGEGGDVNGVNESETLREIVEDIIAAVESNEITGSAINTYDDDETLREIVEDIIAAVESNEITGSAINTYDDEGGDVMTKIEPGEVTDDNGDDIDDVDGNNEK